MKGKWNKLGRNTDQFDWNWEFIGQIVVMGMFDIGLENWRKYEGKWKKHKKGMEGGWTCWPNCHFWVDAIWQRVKRSRPQSWSCFASNNNLQCWINLARIPPFWQNSMADGEGELADLNNFSGKWRTSTRTEHSAHWIGWRNWPNSKTNSW